MTRRALRLLLLPLLAALALLFPAFAPASQPHPPAAPDDASAPSLATRPLARLPHDAQAFTQGLILHQGAFYESTGLYGQSSLRRVDPATGRVLARHALPRTIFGEGLALCPKDSKGAPARLVQLTWREGRILTYDAETLRPLGQHRLRGQGWGLACGTSEASKTDGLVLSDGTDTLRWLDAKTMAETGRTLRVRDAGRPVERLNELEWVNGWLLANIWQEDKIAAIRPDTGQVALWLDLSPLRRQLSAEAEAANGIACDPASLGGRGALYLTGKRWDAVFVVELPELLRRPPAPRP